MADITQMRMRISPTVETAFGYCLWNIWTVHAHKNVHGPQEH